MTVDTSSVDLLLDKWGAFATEGWKVPAAEEAIKVVRELTAEGLDADRVPFEAWDEDTGRVYSPAQERRRMLAHVGTSQKDLRVTGDLLDSIHIRELDGITAIAMADNPGDKRNQIALGQMEHPKWRYHHKFFAVGAEMMARVYAAVCAAMKLI